MTSLPDQNRDIDRDDPVLVDLLRRSTGKQPLLRVRHLMSFDTPCEIVAFK